MQSNVLRMHVHRTFQCSWPVYLPGRKHHLKSSFRLLCSCYCESLWITTTTCTSNRFAACSYLRQRAYLKPISKGLRAVEKAITGCVTTVWSDGKRLSALILTSILTCTVSNLICREIVLNHVSLGKQRKSAYLQSKHLCKVNEHDHNRETFMSLLPHVKS